MSDFKIVDRIAVGGLSEIWLAFRENSLGHAQFVALKRCLPHLDGEDFAFMFEDCARLSLLLDHPNIVKTLSYEVDDDGPFMTMEFLPCQPLSALQKSLALIDWQLSTYIIYEVSKALAYAHAARSQDGRWLNVIHRDISPQNVLLTYDGEVKLADFGIARYEGRRASSQPGVIKGRFLYMSPELVMGRPTDQRADIFGLGSLLYELLAGENAFKSDSDFAVLEALRVKTPPPPSNLNPQVPKDLDNVVLKALEKRPEDRFQSAAELCEALAPRSAHASATQLSNAMRRSFHKQEQHTLDLLERLRIKHDAPVIPVRDDRPKD